MEGKEINEFNSKISNNNKDENKVEPFNNNNNRIFFNSVTGELMNPDDGDEKEMYEVVRDMEQYAEDNINQYTDICEKDKEFFKLWNSFINSKDNKFLNFEDILINFLNKHSKYLCENNLRKNFVLHLIAVYDNRQINYENLVNIVDIMYELFKKYEKKSTKNIAINNATEDENIKKIVLNKLFSSN